MEALPSKADPALAGGPVSLPAQAAVLHGVRSASLSQQVACCLGCCGGRGGGVFFAVSTVFGCFNCLLLFQLFRLMCRASDYYSRSSSGRHDRHYDREPDRYQSEKHKPVVPTQVMTSYGVAELASCKHVIAHIDAAVAGTDQIRNPKGEAQEANGSSNQQAGGQGQCQECPEGCARGEGTQGSHPN